MPRLHVQASNERSGSFPGRSFHIVLHSHRSTSSLLAYFTPSMTLLETALDGRDWIQQDSIGCPRCWHQTKSARAKTAFHTIADPCDGTYTHFCSREMSYFCFGVRDRAPQDKVLLSKFPHRNQNENGSYPDCPRRKTLR